jgi:hypothetical protein
MNSVTDGLYYGEHDLAQLDKTHYYRCNDCHKWFHEVFAYSEHGYYRRSRWLYAHISWLNSCVWCFCFDIAYWFSSIRNRCE